MSRWVLSFLTRRESSRGRRDGWREAGPPLVLWRGKMSLAGPGWLPLWDCGCFSLLLFSLWLTLFSLMALILSALLPFCSSGSTFCLDELEVQCNTKLLNLVLVQFIFEEFELTWFEAANLFFLEEEEGSSRLLKCIWDVKTWPANKLKGELRLDDADQSLNCCFQTQQTGRVWKTSTSWVAVLFTWIKWWWVYFCEFLKLLVDYFGFELLVTFSQSSVCLLLNECFTASVCTHGVCLCLNGGKPKCADEVVQNV